MKFILCVTLIVSLLTPSYAALSMTDGSDFVTKAELDSILSNFNSRLTMFESGVNSKIDSQVTSYLDRNGIWKGLKQTVSNISIPFKDLYSHSQTFYKNVYQDSSKRKVTINETKLIEKINKSGLLFFETQWSDCWSVNPCSSIAGYWGYLGNADGVLELGIYEKNTTTGADVWKVLASIPNIIILQAQPYDGSTYSSISADKAKLLTQCFVKEGQTLYGKLQFIWSGTSSLGNRDWNDNPAGDSINNVTKAITDATLLTLYNVATIY